MSIRAWYDEPASRAVVAAKRRLAMEARVDARLAGPPAPIVRLPKKAYGVIK